MDADTGQVIYAKNPHLRLPNASTTKIMTAILLIEHCKLTDKIKASKTAAETPHTSLHLKPGECISAKDLLTGMLVRSANDAAVAAAERVAGDVPSFVTPNGLYDPGHYTTVYDLCLMARYAFRYPVFNEAVCTKKYFLNSRTMNKEDLAVFTHSRFLKNYPGADGVKSGYTKQAKRCYVGSATRNGWRLVSAVLGSSNAADDTAALMDYGFGSFQLMPVVSTNQKCADARIDGAWRATVPAVAEKALRVPVRKTGGAVTTRVELLPVRAPIKQGAKLGKLKALVDGEEVAAVGLRAGESDGISLARHAWIVTKWCGVIAVCLVGGIYVGTVAKGARRRGRGVASPVRSDNRRR
jgi:D-alanyl-D-alanine carboxypeptidase (penicillin-binding protein 5/6)